MADTHSHIIGPKRPGRPSLDEHRCINCGKSTRFMKQKIQCPAESTSPGGTLCLTCAEHFDTNTGTCTDWISQCTPTGCQKCLKNCHGVLFTCDICDSEICQECTETTCLERFFQADISYFVCNQCIPLQLRSDERGRSSMFLADQKFDFCVFCQDWHLAEAFGGDGCDYDGNNCPPIVKKILQRDYELIDARSTTPDQPVRRNRDTTTSTSDIITKTTENKQITTTISSNDIPPTRPESISIPPQHTKKVHDAHASARPTANDLQIRDLIAQQAAQIANGGIF